MTPRPAGAVGTQHLGAMVSAYVDRVLPPPLQQACDLHLVSCAVCREAAAAERRLLGSLRDARTPAPPSDLRASLLGLATQTAERSPTPVGPAPLGVVSPHAPALHRSPVRAAMLAGLAAGASAAAAWSIGVAAPAPPAARPATRPVSPSVGRVTVTPLRVPAFTVRTVSAVVVSRSPASATAPSVTAHSARWAESPHD